MGCKKTGFHGFQFSWFPDRSDTNHAVQSQKMARGLKCLILEVEELYHLHVCTENKGADQLCGYLAADLCLCFAYAKSRFSHDAQERIQDFWIGVSNSERGGSIS